VGFSCASAVRAVHAFAFIVHCKEKTNGDCFAQLLKKNIAERLGSGPDDANQIKVTSCVFF